LWLLVLCCGKPVDEYREKPGSAVDKQGASGCPQTIHSIFSTYPQFFCGKPPAGNPIREKGVF
jgi:hypothetical protein